MSKTTNVTTSRVGNRITMVLLLLFFVVNLAYLPAVPGLMGDEASEGYNVYELQQKQKPAWQGERSYIGPFLDYVRMPFVAGFGYTAIALRVPIFMASLAAFILAAAFLRRYFSIFTANIILAFVFFSPIYVTQQRLGWAITLIPAFAILLLFLLTTKFPHRALLAGLVVGLGLHNHILFLPTALGIIVAAAVQYLYQKIKTKEVLRIGRDIVGIWPAIIGFWAGFATQFIMLLRDTSDQTDIRAVAESVSSRLTAFPSLVRDAYSGSAYIARYTGQELSPSTITLTLLALGILIIAGFIWGKKRLELAWWSIGLLTQGIVLLFMIDRFSLRYFVSPILGLWLLAGFGLSTILRASLTRSSALAPGHWQGLAPIAIAVLMTVLNVYIVLLPFLRTGGSTASFSLGNRTDSAAALIDTKPLFACLERAGAVRAANVHIYNRLQYVHLQNPVINVLPEEEQGDATTWVVDYRLVDRELKSPSEELCPELRNWTVSRSAVM